MFLHILCYCFIIVVIIIIRLYPIAIFFIYLDTFWITVSSVSVCSTSNEETTYGRCRNKFESFQFVSNILVSNRYEGRRKSIEIGGGYICIVESVSSDINALFDTTSKFCTTRNSIRHTVLFDVLKFFIIYVIDIHRYRYCSSIRCCTLSLCWYTLKVMF